MRALSKVRSFLKGSFPATCSYYLADNLLGSLRFRAGKIDTTSGMAHAERCVESSIQYIEEVFADYKRYAKVQRFHGKVAEVGPGDSSGVGLLFLADGCSEVDLVDRFYSKRSVERNAEVYRALFARYPQLAARLGQADARDEGSFAGIFRRYGDMASAEEFFRGSRGYDFIVSRAVFEHLYDPMLAIRRMSDALNPGGMLLHKVDLRDHGMFSEFFHELKFLEVPDSLYPAMTRSSGRPNRRLVHEYRRVLRNVLPDHELLVTRLAGFGDIDPHVPYDEIPKQAREKALAYVDSVRAAFSASLASVSAEDLSVAGLFVVARKTR